MDPFNRRLRDECLNVNQCRYIEDAEAKIDAWRIEGNRHRPHGSLGHLTPVHLDFVVDDIDAAVARAGAAGARLERPVSTSKWGRLAVMADPFGHGLCFVQFLGRGYDEIAD